MSTVEDVLQHVDLLTSTQLKELQITLIRRSQPHQLREFYQEINQLLSFDIISRLPLDIVDHIFSYLDVSSLCAVSQCCHQWRLLANNDKLWYNHCRLKGFTLYETLPSPRWDEEGRPTSPRRKVHDITRIPVIIKPLMCHWKKIYMKASVLTSNWEHGLYTVCPLLRSHKEPVTALAVEDDILVSGSRDCTVRIWSLRSLSTILTLQGHTDEVTTLILKNGLIVTGCGDGVVRVYSSSTGQCLWSLETVQGGVDHVAFDENIIVSASTDCSLQVWQFKGGHPVAIATLQGHTKPITCIQLYSFTIVTGSWDSTIRIWDCKDGICRHVLPAHFEGVNCVLIYNDKLISGGGDCKVKLWEPITGQSLVIMAGHNQEVLCIQANEKLIISSSADSTIRLWNYNGICLHVLENHIGLVRCLCLYGHRLISGGDRKRVNIWDIERGVLLHTVHRQQILLHLMCVTDTMLITASPDNGAICVIKYW